MKITELGLYILLIVHFPLFYYSNNLFDLSTIAFIEILPISFAMGFSVVGISILVTKIIKKPTSPIFVLVNIFLFFSYGIFFEYFVENKIQMGHIYLIAIFVSIFLASLKFSPKLSKKLSKIIFVILVAFIVMDTYTLISEYTFSTSDNYWREPPDTSKLNLESLPNIIFILPDEYPSKLSLQAHFGYDNSMFLEKLENMGFKIGDTNSNYMLSAQSIPSMFNMNYLTHMDQNYDYEDEISESVFLRLLKQNGYELTQINGADRMYSKIFDIHLCSPVQLEKHVEFYKLTVIFPIFEKMLYENTVNNRLCFFEELSQIKNLEEQKRFVYAHVLMPHSPFFTEDENGNLIQIAEHLDQRSFFINNVEIVNNKLISLLPNLINNNPNSIIIIMSDHGEREGFKVFKDMTMFENFYAVYVPKNYELEEIKSNVNVFRSVIHGVDDNTQFLEDEFFVSCKFDIIQIPNRDNFKIICD